MLSPFLYSLIISLYLINMADGIEGIEGTDYYYDRAMGKNVSCASRCEPPSSYPSLCEEKCRGYMRKLRFEATEASPSDSNLSNLQWIIPIVVLAVILPTIILLAYKCRRKLCTMVTLLKEMYCERPGVAVQETQNGAESSEMPTLVNDPLLHDRVSVV